MAPINRLLPVLIEEVNFNLTGNNDRTEYVSLNVFLCNHYSLSADVTMLDGSESAYLHGRSRPTPPPDVLSLDRPVGALFGSYSIISLCRYHFLSLSTSLYQFIFSRLENWRKEPTAQSHFLRAHGALPAITARWCTTSISESHEAHSRR